MKNGTNGWLDDSRNSSETSPNYKKLDRKKTLSKNVGETKEALGLGESRGRLAAYSPIFSSYQVINRRVATYMFQGKCRVA